MVVSLSLLLGENPYGLLVLDCYHASSAASLSKHVCWLTLARIGHALSARS